MSLKRCLKHDPARDEARPEFAKANPDLTPEQIETTLDDLGEMEKQIHPERFEPCPICKAASQQTDILVTVHDDGQREHCPFEDWYAENMNQPETAAQIVELIENCAIITLDGDAQTAGRRMWLESNEVDASFCDEPGAERLYVV